MANSFYGSFKKSLSTFLSVYMKILLGKKKKLWEIKKSPRQPQIETPNPQPREAIDTWLPRLERQSPDFFWFPYQQPLVRTDALSPVMVKSGSHSD